MGAAFQQPQLAIDAEPQADLPRTRWRKPLGYALLLVSAGVAALPLDLPLARLCLAETCPDPLAKLLLLAEAFGHGIGVAVILLTAAILDSRGRRAIGRVALLALGAGLAANLIKLAVARARPREFLLEIAAGQTEAGLSIRESFAGWFPLGANTAAMQGFPSSHVATAVGLAIGLSQRYPRGRAWFFFLALLVAGQRVLVSAHFLSDTLFGAAVGVISAEGLRRRLGRIESIDPSPIVPAP